MRIQLSDHFTYGKLVRFTIPSIAMMIFASVYGVVDGFFVSNFAGKTPFSAVNLIMPFLMIAATVGFMFGTGGTAIVAKTLGEGKQEKAGQYFSLFVYVTFVLGVIFAVLGIVFIRPLSVLLGAEGELLENCIVYARIILAVLPFYVLQLLFQSFFVAAEKPQLGLAVTISAGVTNMILDAVLVTLLPQEYKLAGAAAATAASQLVGGIIPLFYFFRKNDSLLRLGKTSFDGGAVLKACTNGSSEFMSNVSMSIVGMLYNKQLLKYAGENGITAYGAGNYKESKGLLRKSLIMIGIFGICMVAAAEWLAEPLAKIFVGYDAELMMLTISGFRVFALSFAFMGFAIFGSGFFTALGDGLTSALISFLRTVVFQTAAVLLLPLVWKIDGVWISIVVAEVMAVMLSAVFLVVKRKKYHYWE